MLQIVDIALNNFSGEIRGKVMTTWQTMMVAKGDVLSELNQLRFRVFEVDEVYYQDTVTVINKGLEMQLVKILTVFTSIDLSCNNFTGSIPKEMGDLLSLYVLNLSSNALTGEIPSSVGDLQDVESLDLSNNKLSGQIPPQLAKLTFLSFLNLSNNQLVGKIPISTQFSTFPQASFTGNKGLSGPPLTVDNESVSPPPTVNESLRNCGHHLEINWGIISVEIGYTFGLGVAIGSLVLCKRWSKWYYKAMYNILLKIFPELEERIGIHRRHVNIK
ncbi:hypothetical protein Pyn_21788 [Prunus yedoensis var. nudiflora]|uniref:Receptor-like protein 12 n=1 Tax=Prunus yedoensis var. nudiflora TaxID=2094558 RepID=A0A314UA61_PRUYE|nr:hypothetical protein Pyn_21788 [Prunus yedoensis var. nudiflora]